MRRLGIVATIVILGLSFLSSCGSGDESSSDSDVSRDDSFFTEDSDQEGEDSDSNESETEDSPQGSEALDPEEGVVFPQEPTEGAPVLEIYTDFLCPHCATLENDWGHQLQAAAQNGQLTLVLHHFSFLDESMPGADEYSARATNAALCVADAYGPEKYLTFRALLFEYQPADGESGPEDLALVQLAETNGSPIEEDCVTERQFADHVADEAEAARDRGVTGVPALYLDGEPFDTADLGSLLQ